MPTTWTIAIDWDRNNNFTGTYDDVTSRVISAKWMLGMREAYEDTADSAVLDITLDNADKVCSPDSPAPALVGKVAPQHPVRIQSHDGTTTSTHWAGWIEAIKPTVGRFGERAGQREHHRLRAAHAQTYE